MRVPEVFFYPSVYEQFVPRAIAEQWFRMYGINAVPTGFAVQKQKGTPPVLYFEQFGRLWKDGEFHLRPLAIGSTYTQFFFHYDEYGDKRYGPEV